jgi:hypothetical protein
MLLRQALEQTRTGRPTPVLFNSRIASLDPGDEVHGVAQEKVFDMHFHTRHHRANNRPFQPNHRAAAAATGAHAS